MGPQARRIGKVQTKKRGKASVSVRDLVDGGLLSPGKGKLTVTYKGVTYTASLRADGLIQFRGKALATQLGLWGCNAHVSGGWRHAWQAWQPGHAAASCSAAGGRSGAASGRAWHAYQAPDGSVLLTGMEFSSATAFSIHCKRLQTPSKLGDDGWKSVLYEGTPLDAFRRKFEAGRNAARPSEVGRCWSGEGLPKPQMDKS